MTTIKQKIIAISDEILNFLLEFKKKDPEFTFSIRQRDSPRSNEVRLNEGQWFQGGENYISVPLFKRGDGVRSIKTIGFVITFNSNATIKDNYIEISFKDINTEDEIKFHTDLAKELGVQLENKRGSYYYNNHDQYLANLTDYITRVRNMAMHGLDVYELYETYLIGENEFQKALSKIQQIKLSLNLKKVENTTMNIEKKPSLNQILFGPPGTGKTYHTINKAIAIINPAFNLKQERNLIKQEYDRLVNEGQIVFTTFHQSMSYEDFIEGIKPIPPKGENSSINYKIQSGLFKEIVAEAGKVKQKTIKLENETQVLTEELFEDLYYQFAENLLEANEEISNTILNTLEGNEFGLFKNSNGSITIKAGLKKTKMSASLNELTQVLFHKKTPTYKSYENILIKKILEENSYSDSDINNSQKRFVLIVDEINRGNVSQIFGELITLIEEDKRLGNDEALEVTLPYSKEKFGVPPNLYIIGTMNTADRSVEALDTALRRRFSFEEMQPRYDLEELNYEFAGFEISDILMAINKRIEKLLNKDHVIGHSYFMLKSDENVEEKLITAFYKNIIPLLQEYFFGDYSKIGLVLGKGFVRKSLWNNDNKNSTESFADFDAESASDFEDREVYEIIDYRISSSSPDEKNIQKNISINFEKAIQLLMNKAIA